MNLIKLLKKKKIQRYLIGIGAILIVLLLLSKLIIAATLVAATILISFLIQSLNLRESGIELTTFTTIILGIVFGPAVGAFSGFILSTILLMFGGYFGIFVMWVIPGYIVAGAIAGFTGGTAATIASFGFMTALILNLVFVLFTLIFNPGHLVRYLPYAFLNVLVNYILFRFIAPLVMKLMI